LAHLSITSAAGAKNLTAEAIQVTRLQYLFLVILKEEGL
jgi:hypothetical protein